MDSAETSICQAEGSSSPCHFSDGEKTTMQTSAQPSLEKNMGDKITEQLGVTDSQTNDMCSVH